MDRRPGAWGVLILGLSALLGVATIVAPSTTSPEVVFEKGENEYMLPDTTMAEFRAHMLRLNDCYYDAMVMPPWRVEVEFWDLDGDILAQTGANPYYFNAVIRYDLELLAAEDSADVRGTVIHELFHILSWELGLYAEAEDYQVALGLQEKLASRIEQWGAMLAVCG